MSGICVLFEQPCFRSVYEGLSEAGMSCEDKDRNSLLVWHDSLKDCDFFSPLSPWQIVNRLPCINVICRKAPFTYLLQRMKNIFPEYFGFMPQSFILPKDKEEFDAALAKSDKTFIYKPDSASQGSGIIIINPGEKKELPEGGLAIAQQYIESYLINEKKFDLRLYVLVASLNPLRIYVYRNGLARFCSERYEEGGTRNIFSQLTNVTINRENPHADISEVSQLVSDIIPELEAKGVDIKKLWQRIDNAIVLTIISAHKTLSLGEKINCPSIGYSRCFQILGFDILLDRDLNPWILEVNNRPSLDYYRGKERRMKVGMIRDAARIAVPMEEVQQALFIRKWGWTRNSWSNFIKQNPQLLKHAEEQRQCVLQNTLFEQAYPNPENPMSQAWEEARTVANTLPVEKLPGFQFPRPPVP